MRNEAMPPRGATLIPSGQHWDPETPFGLGASLAAATWAVTIHVNQPLEGSDTPTSPWGAFFGVERYLVAIDLRPASCHPH